MSKPDIAKDFKQSAKLMARIQARPSGNEGYLCLGHLYGSLIDPYRVGHKITLGQLAAEAIKTNDKSKNKLLGMWGIRFESGNVYQGTPDQLIVANIHTGLNKLFASTCWSKGGWKQALADLGCQPTKRAHRFGGMNSRGLIIPQQYWPGKVVKVSFLKLTA